MLESEIKFELGRSAFKDGVTANVLKVENTNCGFKVFFRVENNSDKPLKRPCSMQFKIDNPKYEEELNEHGYSGSNEYMNYVYPENSYSGYFEWSIFPNIFKEHFSLKEVTLYIETNKQRFPIGNWVIE